MIHTGEVVNLGIEQAELPNGERMELEIVRHPGGAAVAAVDTRDRVCLIRQYRHAAGGWLWELPAGKIDAGERPVQTAARELTEEAGVRAGRLESLGSFLSTPGFCDERIHLYLALDLAQAQRSPHPHEVIEIHWLRLDQALSLCHEGVIEDAKTLLGLQRAHEWLARRNERSGVEAS